MKLERSAAKGIYKFKVYGEYEDGSERQVVFIEADDMENAEFILQQYIHELYGKNEPIGYEVDQLNVIKRVAI